MDRKLILNNIEIQDSYVLRNGSMLFVYVYAEITFAELFNILNNPANVQTVRAFVGETETDYDGYTELFVIRKEDEGFISAGLRKPV